MMLNRLATFSPTGTRSMNGRRKVTASRRGAMLVLIAICLPLIVILAAFAVDVAWMQLVRTELRTATDAAARAACDRARLAPAAARTARRVVVISGYSGSPCGGSSAPLRQLTSAFRPHESSDMISLIC